VIYSVTFVMSAVLIS